MTTAAEQLAAAQHRKIQRLQRENKRLQAIAAANGTAVPGAKFALEKYKSNRWLIRHIETGQIVAYPGIELSNVAASWLRFECGEDGDQAHDLGQFGELVMAAEARILAALNAHI